MRLSTREIHVLYSGAQLLCCILNVMSNFGYKCPDIYACKCSENVVSLRKAQRHKRRAEVRAIRSGIMPFLSLPPREKIILVTPPSSEEIPPEEYSRHYWNASPTVAVLTEEFQPSKEDSAILPQAEENTSYFDHAVESASLSNRDSV